MFNKIISAVIAISFIFTNTTYGMSIGNQKDTLRQPALGVSGPAMSQNMVAALGASPKKMPEPLYSFTTQGIPNFHALEQRAYREDLAAKAESAIASGAVIVDGALKDCMQDAEAGGIFREYDLREHMDVFTAERTRAILAAQMVLALQMGNENNKKYLVAADQENYNAEGVAIAVEEAKRAGFEVIHIAQPVPAPVAYMAAILFGVDNIAFFSASHNPYGDKGLKLGIKKGTTFAPYGTALIKDISMRGLRVKEVQKHGTVTELESRGLEPILDYYHSIHKQLGIELTPEKFHLIVNSIFGTAGRYEGRESTVEYLLKKMGFQESDYEMMMEEMQSSLRIPGKRQPNPELEWVGIAMLEKITAAVERHVDKIIVAMAFDRDADRTKTYGEGAQSTADKLGVLAIRQLAANYRRLHPGDKRTIVAYVDMKCSLLVFEDEVLKDLGVDVRPTKTGHSYLKWHLRDQGRSNTDEVVLAAFEQSGHCFYKMDPATPESEIVEDPLAFIFSILQYLETNNQTLAQALETTAPYTVGPSTKFYLDPAKFDAAETGEANLKNRKYSIMKKITSYARSQIGALVASDQYKIIGVEDIDEDSMRIFFANPAGTRLLGSVVFRPSSNEEVSTINIDCISNLKEVLGITPKQFISDIQNFVVFDLAAASFEEFTTLCPVTEGQKLGLLNSPVSDEAMKEYALANGWRTGRKLAGQPGKNKLELIHKTTHRTVVAKAMPSITTANPLPAHRILQPHNMPTYRYEVESLDFPVQQRIVPWSTKGDAAVIGEEELLALALEPGWAVIITEDYVDMSYAASFLDVALWTLAEGGIQGIATGATQDSFRMGAGVSEQHRALVHKMRKAITLDGYYFPEGVFDPRIVDLNAYGAEQGWMYLENLLANDPRSVEDVLISPLRNTRLSHTETALEFDLRIRDALDAHGGMVKQNLGVGPDGHSAFNLTVSRREGTHKSKPRPEFGKLVLTIDMLKTLIDVPDHALTPRDYSVYADLPFLKPTHPVVIPDIVKINNIGHFLPRGFNKAWVRLMSEARAFHVPELLDIIGRLGSQGYTPGESPETTVERIVEKINNEIYPGEPEYQFESAQKFLEELEYLLEHYYITPALAVTQGTGTTLMGTRNIVIPKTNTPGLLLAIASNSHKSTGTRLAIDQAPSIEATVSIIQLAENGLMVADSKAASMLDQTRCFLFRPTDTAAAANMANAESQWQQSGAGRRVAATIRDKNEAYAAGDIVFPESAASDFTFPRKLLEGYADATRRRPKAMPASDSAANDAQQLEEARIAFAQAA